MDNILDRLCDEILKHYPNRPETSFLSLSNFIRLNVEMTKYGNDNLRGVSILKIMGTEVRPDNRIKDDTFFIGSEKELDQMLNNLEFQEKLESLLE